MSSKKLCYIWDQSLIEQCDRIPAVKNRVSLVHDLIAAYDLINYFKVIRPAPASYQDLKQFHSELYLDHLKSFLQIEDDYMTNAQDETYGIGYDCPPVSNIYELVSVIAGGSITAAKCLLLGISDVVINWCGGWHHAQRFEAQGFCYVNDIVLAIEKLRLKFNKILYIDLDVHHGNGVQDAYNLSQSVFTLSFHKYEPGFYPGSGGLDDIGTLTGSGYKCNFPLHAFYTDKTIDFVFAEVFPIVSSTFKPDAIVMQCGADALAYDPHGGACLTEQGYKSCLSRVLEEHKPTILLGGGGYNHPNAARLWANLTAVVAGVTLDNNIPEHDHWPKYGPDYQLPVQPSLAKDLNKEQYLIECIAKIKYTIETADGKKEKILSIKRNNNAIETNSQQNLIHKESKHESKEPYSLLTKDRKIKYVNEDRDSGEKVKNNDVYDFQD